MAPTSKKTLLPGSVRNELRRAVSLKCLNKVHLSDKMKVKHEQEMMFDLFHGCPRKEIVSNLDLLLQREGPYATMFEEKEQRMVTAQSASCVLNKYILKPTFHRRNEVIELDKHIKREFLEKATFDKKSPLVPGRTLKNTAEATLRSVKVANSFALPFLKEDGTPLKSGWSIEDVIYCVLDSMNHRSGKIISIESDEEDEIENGSDFETAAIRGEAGNDLELDETINEEPDSALCKNLPLSETPLPDEYVFDGYYAFLLFGAVAPKSDQLQILFCEDPDDKSKVSRASKRKVDKEESFNERQRNIGNPHNQSGLKLNERIALANLNESSVSRQDRSNEATIISYKLQLDAIDKRLNRAEKHGNTEEVSRLSEKESEIMKKMEDATEEISNSAKKARSSNVFDLIDFSELGKEDK